VVDKKNGDLTAFLPRTCFQQQEFVHHALIRTKADGIAKDSRHGAKLTSVRTTPAGLHRNNSKGSPAGTHALQERLYNLGKQIELLKLDFVPGNLRIGLKRWFAFLVEVIHGRVEILERPARSIFHDSGPCLI